MVSGGTWGHAVLTERYYVVFILFHMESSLEAAGRVTAGPAASPVQPRTEHLLYPEVRREMAPLEGEAGRGFTPCGWEDPGPRNVVLVGGELLCDTLDLSLRPGLPSSLHLSPQPCGAHWGRHVLMDHGQR